MKKTGSSISRNPSGEGGSRSHTDLRSRRLGPVVLLALVAFPFVLALLTGQPVTTGTPKFWQGMLIQVFILAVYAMSYDLMLGYTGILSFGHAMFFGVGAYATGILLKHAGWSLGPVVLLVIGVAIAARPPHRGRLPAGARRLLRHGHAGLLGDVFYPGSGHRLS